MSDRLGTEWIALPDGGRPLSRILDDEEFETWLASFAVYAQFSQFE